MKAPTPTQQVVTRIAPSPTGLFHVGTARTALYNYLFAKKRGGKFLVRIEDTDTARSTKAFEENILHGLQALGLTWDDEVIRQSERVARHTECLEQLVQEGKAYVSEEPAKEDPSRNVQLVRLTNPGKIITFRDEVRGDIQFDTAELGDLIIARSLTDPLYHFAVVVDDADAAVTHVIRGEDHISNTPRQILIQEALGFTRPQYAHLPLILAPDRSKLSKRRGAVSISEYLNDGYLPEALNNFLALLGWSSGTDQEVFTLGELVQAYSFEGTQKSGGVFDVDRLKWFNREHMKRREPAKVHADLVAYVHEFPKIQEIMSHSLRVREDLLERYSTFREITDAIAEGEFSFYEVRPTLEKAALAWKKDPAPEEVGSRLSHIRTLLDVVDDFTYDTLKAAVWPYAEEAGRGPVLWSLRYALSGKERSPDPFLLAEALGKAESLARIDAAIIVVQTT